jgi:hypothetical protein
MFFRIMILVLAVYDNIVPGISQRHSDIGKSLRKPVYV